MNQKYYYKIEEIKNKIILGDCLEELEKFPDNSVDAIITDPPAGIGFMGKEWDKYSDFKILFIKSFKSDKSNKTRRAYLGMGSTKNKPSYSNGN